MATTVMTTDGKTQRTIDFHDKTNMYMGIGRTTAWTSEPTPDAVAVSIEEIEELQAIKKIATADIKYVREQTGGEITFNGTEWTEIPEAEKTETGTDISFDNTSGEIRTTAGDFTDFVVGEKIKVIGTSNNDGVYFTITTAAALVGDPLVVTPAPTDESAGVSFEVKSNLFTNDIIHLYLKADLEYDDGTPDTLPLITYRQVGSIYVEGDEA